MLYAPTMEYRRLGSSGLLVSAVGLGTNNFGSRLDEGATRLVLDQALESGVTFIDTSDSYGRGASETVIGRILGPRRRDVVLATKFSSPMSESQYERGTSRRWLSEAVEGSLRRLETDVIDLYQIHFPDPATPIDETLRALDDLVATGKVRYVGYSNFAAWQIVEGQWTARTEHLVRPISSQNHFNLLRREVERDVLPAARAHGLGIIPYYPLESGFLTGKYRSGLIPDGARLVGSPRADEVLSSTNFERLARWEALAAERGHGLLELAFGWLLGHPEVGSVIAGARSAEQVRLNVDAAAWTLDATDMTAVAAMP
jgi:aryl-alcohol dehydrogenase-like predicted oxidoreductase